MNSSQTIVRDASPPSLSIPAASQAAHGLSWLARLPAGLFAIPVGLFGLAGAWRRAIGYQWIAAAGVADALLWLATLLWAALLALHACKCMRYPRIVQREALHPVSGSLMALAPQSVLLAAIQWSSQESGIGYGWWLALVLAALAAQGFLALRVVSILATGQLQPNQVTPALYLPIVGLSFVGGMALAVLQHGGWAALLFGMGIAGWALLELRVLNTLFRAPMPEPLRATIGVELAPPAVATLAAATIWPALPADGLIIGLGIAAGPFIAVLVRYRWWSTMPFSAGFWSFSFPLAALAGAMVEAGRRGGWPELPGAAGLLAASLVIGYLALRTLMLLVRGKLLPPA